MPGALGLAVLAAAGLLAVGVWLRATWRPLRVLYVPAAVVAGAIGLVGVRLAAHGLPFVADTARALAGEWSSWPGTLISVVFAGLLLETPRAGGFTDALRRGLRSGLLAWVIILGQIAVGLTVYLVAVRPTRPDVPATFGQLLEVSWAGGFGSAAAMAKIYAGQAFPEGGDLAYVLASVGLVYGVLSGLIFVNVAVRRGWCAAAGPDAAPDRIDAAAASAGAVPVGGGIIEPLAVQVLVLAAAFAVGLLLQGAFAASVGWLIRQIASGEGAARSIEAAGNVPLFLFTLLGGSVVRRTMAGLGAAGWIDSALCGRIVGVAMEFLIVSGIAAMRLDALGRFGGPVLLLLLGAATWSAVCLFVLSPRLLPRAYWFELGLLNYGFSTANTPQGMMLLRIVDPRLRSGAAADYAVAAPLSAPFVGGGVVTFLVLPLLLGRLGAEWVLAGVVALIVALYAVGRRLARQRPR